MRAARAGRFEYEVEAAIEAVYLRNGAMSWGYPSIVGSGPNATILHYEKSSRRMEPGDLLLVDAAANYQGLTGDITRTYPVDGKFSPGAARHLRHRVRGAASRREGGAKRRDRRATYRPRATRYCVRAWCAWDSSPIQPGMQFKMWATHGVTHWIGMDVHDVGVPRGRSRLAWRSRSNLASTSARRRSTICRRRRRTRAFIEKVRPMVAKYKNIGVRIEDSYLADGSGLERLSKSVPRTVDEIETFLKRDSATFGREAGLDPRFLEFRERLLHFLPRRLALAFLFGVGEFVHRFLKRPLPARMRSPPPSAASPLLKAA